MKAKLINRKIVKGLPKFYTTSKVTYIGDFDKQTDEIHKAEGFYPVVKPDYDSETQRLGEIYFDEENEVFTYPVNDIPKSELDERKQHELYMKDKQFDQEAAKRLLRKVAEPILADEANITEQDVEDAKMFYKQYRIGVVYDKDSEDSDKRFFVKDGTLYRVVGAKHTSQEDWPPETTLSLYRKVIPPDAVTEWHSDIHLVIQEGDKVSWNGKTYECIDPTYAWIEPGTQDSDNAWKEVT